MHLADLICGVNRKIEQSIEASLKPYGLSIEQYRVLEALSARNGLPMGDLAARVFVDSPTLTKIIDKMVASADVYRGPDPQDRRRVLVFMSGKGAKTHAQLRDIGEAMQQRLLEKLGARGGAELQDVLLSLLSETKPAGGSPVYLHATGS